MKIFIILSLLSIFLFADSNFCRGFERGYIIAYMDKYKTPLEPLTPLCPIPPLKGIWSLESDYEQGYLVAFKYVYGIRN